MYLIFFKKLNAVMGGGKVSFFSNVVSFLAFSALPFLKEVSKSETKNHDSHY